MFAGFYGGIFGKKVILPAKNNGESCNSSKQIHVATGEFCLPFYRRCLRRIRLPKEPGSGVKNDVLDDIIGLVEKHAGNSPYEWLIIWLIII